MLLLYPTKKLILELKGFKEMKIRDIDLNFKLRTLLPRNNTEKYIKAKQKYADAEYIVEIKDSINNTSENRSNQVMRNLGLF
jgi:hypothetical protein